MPGLVPGIHVFAAWQERRGRETTPFFERLFLAMTNANSIERDAL
jgi:hypothetical protein